VTVEYHYIEGQYERLPTLVADFVRRRVAVIATPGSTPAALAAKAATSTIPIVFGVGDDPVKLGLVASLARPGGNALLGSPEGTARNLAALRQGLSETGYIEGRNVASEYRWAEGNFDRLAALASELAQKRVNVIVTPDHPRAALAAKVATTSIPIVFSAAADPVQYGLVASLNRPGGNVTGIYDMGIELGGKRLGILDELMPPDVRFGVLINPEESGSVDLHIATAKAAAAATGRQIEVFTASSSRGIETAFESLMQKHVGALAVVPNVLFGERMVQIITLATRQASIFSTRRWTPSGWD
jgi:putative ABC transport system substrate-binding protein